MQTPGGRRTRITQTFAAGIVLAVVGIVGVNAGVAHAFDLDALRERLEAQRQHRINRLLQLRDRIDEVQDDAGDGDTGLPQKSSGQCECDARVSWDDMRIDLERTSNSLIPHFVPVIDISIDVEGEGDGQWRIDLNYNGRSDFEGEDITGSLPASAAFSGTKSWGGSCHEGFDRSIDRSGIRLEPVSLGTLARSLFSVEDAEVEGEVRARAELTGCAADVDEDTLDFGLEKDDGFIELDY